MQNQNEPLVSQSSTSKIHPLVKYIIASDLLAMSLAVLGLFLPTINTIGASLKCIGGTLTILTTQNFPPGVINCVQNGTTEEITYMAMAFTFVFFSLVFGVLSSIYYMTTQNKKL